MNQFVAGRKSLNVFGRQSLMSDDVHGKICWRRAAIAEELLSELLSRETLTYFKLFEVIIGVLKVLSKGGAVSSKSYHEVGGILQQVKSGVEVS